MSRVRRTLHGALHWGLHAAGWSADPSDARTRLHTVLDKVCDIELAIIAETSRERCANQLQRTEQLATIGQVAASIGHDLRNPLAVIQTSVHMLSRRLNDDPRSERHLKRISEQITLCTVIIADLLELARNRPPDRVPTFMPDLVREAANSVPKARGVTVALDIDDRIEAISVDAGQVRQLVVNLVLNAIQAVGAEGGVGVKLREDDDASGGGALLTVEDSGAGFPEETLRRLFQPMFTTRVGGTGLGLVLCRKVVEAHDGRIHAENRAEGGARFQVSLPRDAPASDSGAREVVS
jgi:signal transduction histidine kinase